MSMLTSARLLFVSSAIVAVSGCAAPAEGDDDQAEEAPASTDESALETMFTRSYGNCNVTYEQNQSYARITQNGHCDYMSLAVTCRDSKGTWGSYTSALNGDNNPIYVDRTCFTRPKALPWWPNWNHVYSKYTSMVAVDFCVGQSFDACTRWRWSSGNAR